MVKNVKDSLPELFDRNFKRHKWMEEFDQPMDGIDFLIGVMSERHFNNGEEKTKSVSLNDMVLGIKQDDGFEKVTKYIFEYLSQNNEERTEREIMLYMFLLSDEIKQGIAEYKN